MKKYSCIRGPKNRRMKIRIKDNSVRYRLTRSEVTELGEKGFLSAATAFTDRPFLYSIEAVETRELSVAFVENTIVLKMPKTMIDELVHTGKVGFSGQSGAVKLLVEKDFACIDNTLEDQSDNYPNPNLTC